MQYYRGYEIKKGESLFSILEEGVLINETDSINEAMLYIDYLYEVDTQEADYSNFLHQADYSEVY